jgi:hypothetical protein
MVSSCRDPEELCKIFPLGAIREDDTSFTFKRTTWRPGNSPDRGLTGQLAKKCKVRAAYIPPEAEET